MYGLQDMLACFGVVDKRVALRAVDDLKVLRSRLAEDGLRGHGVEKQERVVEWRGLADETRFFVGAVDRRIDL